ncbi:MAG: glycine cleavage system protein GcvH [Methylocapsa sp.]|nr:glycine cleavage system protein GcvH [Methylocapsa sp.]
MDTRYTETHEYIRIDGKTGIIGITDYAQAQLGDVVFVELPKAGDTVAKGAPAAAVESVKAAAEINSPASGEVLEANGALADSPALVNEDPAGKGWFFKIRLSDAGELDSLMSEETYIDFVKSIS